MPFIYHGTDASHIDDIFDRGLQPRQSTGRSNWSQDGFESLPGHVYMSRLYAIYFGMGAVDSLDESIAVYEIDLDRLELDSLYPDEDFIEQAMRNQNVGIGRSELVDYNEGIVERTKSVRENIDEFKEYWNSSLDFFGNISHKGHIPPEAIRRVSIINAPSWFYLLIDPTITIQNAQLVGNKYEFYTEIIFGKKYTAEEALVHLYFPHADYENFNSEIINQLKESISENQEEQIAQIVSGDYWEVKENPNY